MTELPRSARSVAMSMRASPLRRGLIACLSRVNDSTNSNTKTEKTDKHYKLRLKPSLACPGGLLLDLLITFSYKTLGARQNDRWNLGIQNTETILFKILVVLSSLMLGDFKFLYVHIRNIKAIIFSTQFTTM